MKKKIIIEIDDHDLYDVKGYSPIGITLQDRVYRAIQNGKPVQESQKTECWIEDWESGLSECPTCHETYLWEDFKGVGDWHYCPNCGKRLEVKRQ